MCNKTILYLISLTLLSFNPGYSQADKIKSELYQKAVVTYLDDHPFITNETLGKVEKFDIDGNFEKWFYGRFRKVNADDTSRISVRIIDVNPVRYSQTINSFLKSRHIDTINTTKLNISNQPDSLNKYIHYDKLISFKKSPWRYSAVGNIFKKKKAYSLSNILFDEETGIAILKIISISKNKSQQIDDFKIVIFRKENDGWNIIGTLERSA